MYYLAHDTITNVEIITITGPAKNLWNEKEDY